MIDFTTKYFTCLIESLSKRGFQFTSFNQYVEDKNHGERSMFIILRHDVDKLPSNSLAIAQIEKELGISGAYYFRAVPESWDVNIIKEISDLGHEIGYHYENMTTCNGNLDKAFTDFKINLEKFRKIVPVTTICMHGSPLSKWDSRDLWKKFDYKTLGLIGEPYFDIDFSKVFYLTDTGRRWDGFKVSRRDRIPRYQDQWEKEGLVFHSTQDIIDAANEGSLPNQIMMTVHPQRWTDKTWPWVKECVMQNIKNQVKMVLNMMGQYKKGRERRLED